MVAVISWSSNLDKKLDVIVSLTSTVSPGFKVVFETDADALFIYPKSY